MRELGENANKDMANLMGALVPRLMIPVLLARAEIPGEKKAHDVTKGERRRLLELELRGQQADYETILKEIVQRDKQDRERAAAPLKQAEDAVLLDTTQLNLEQSVEALLKIVRARLNP